MHSKRPLLILLLVVLAASLVAAASARPEPARVGVCNVRDVVVGYHRFIKLRERLEQEENEIVAEVKKRSQQVDEMLDELRELKQGTDAYKKLDAACWEKTYKIRAYQEVQKSRLERERRNGLRASYQDIKTAIAECAEEKGLDLVLYTRDVDLTQAGNVQELEGIIGSKTVLYKAPRLDITQDVLGRLNEGAESESESE